MGLFDKLFGKEKVSPESASRPGLDAAKVREALKPFKRTAYLPIVREPGNTFSAKSKMGGYPYLRDVSDWPACPQCGDHMQLFLQLNMAEVPEKKTDGLVQLFYCTNFEKECDVEQEGWEPFSKNTVCRKIAVNGDSAVIEPKISDVFFEKEITGWKAIDDYPSTEEYEDLGIALDIYDDHIDDLLEKEKLTVTAGEKLFGWPYWVQNVEYPSDRKTGKAMGLLFQIDSEGHLPFMFGDSGVAHLTQSRDDENEMTFAWACC